MRRSRALVLAFLCVIFTAAASEAVTLKDIIDLTKAGLGDDVLIALIEVDGGVFDVDAATLTRLKAAGVSEKVIVALVRSGRVRPAPQEPQTLANIVAAQQEPEIRYVERPPTTIVHEVEVPVPVYVGVPVAVRGRHVRSGDQVRPADQVRPPDRSTPETVDVVQQPISDPFGSRPPKYQTDTPPPAKPEYWGFGGKLRPDAWKPQ
jgi:hypothetical protein